MEITPEFISELRHEKCDKEMVAKLVNIVDTEPNDLLRVCARVWLNDNAVPLFKKFLLVPST